MTEDRAVMLTTEHMAAVNRPRRIVAHQDVLAMEGVRSRDAFIPARVDDVVDHVLGYLDVEGTQVDSVWLDLGEGNTAVWPSEVLPRADQILPEWWEAGIDPIEVLVAEIHKRDLEAFFSYRVNGSDNDPLYDVAVDGLQLLKAEHPDWVHKPFPNIPQYHWNFEVAEVRDLKIEALHELARLYDFDGIQMDFARVPVLFPPGEQWRHRDLLTDFVRRVRFGLLDVESRSGSPVLLAARVPNSPIGCHFDGMDVERWARERLVDILVLGSRSSDVDLGAFRQMTEGTGIKLYPSWSEHHCSDGYDMAPIEVYRGVYANWWDQGADGVATFNWQLWSPESAARLNIPWPPRWDAQCQVFREIGSPETLRNRDKVFFVQRRGGGHGPDISPSPRDWYTPRRLYSLTNMLAPLPMPLQNGPDSLMVLWVADAVNEAPVQEIELQVEVGGSTSLDALAPKVNARINNLLLRAGTAQGDRLVFPVAPTHLAQGENLVGIELASAPSETGEALTIEKVELHVTYGLE
jgi:hypothetical protein